MMASPPPPRHVPAQLNASYTSLGGDGRTHAPWHDAWMMLGTYFGFGTSVVCSGARGRYILHCTPPYYSELQKGRSQRPHHELTSL